ncbi:helix-turn-helix domain-containing protein [Actinoplanes sp. NPDC000266]
MKVSPYVSRLELADELLDIRTQAGHSSETLSLATGIQRQKISHMETARRRVGPESVEAILTCLSVESSRFDYVMRLALRAAEAGWWERFDDEMGPRQARTADLEQGADDIFQYHPFLFPGLLQTEAFAKVRAEADRPASNRRFSTARMLEARMRRQAILSGPDATPLEVVLDEAVLLRRSAPAEVMQEQLEHLVGCALNQRSVTVRVLPFSADMNRHVQARTAFSHYTYTDPDSMVVVVDTNVDDMLFHDRARKCHDKVAVYKDLVAQLQRSALSPSESVEFLTRAAEDDLSRR